VDVGAAGPQSVAAIAADEWARMGFVGKGGSLAVVISSASLWTPFTISVLVDGVH
jgi:hypothetical protein